MQAALLTVRMIDLVVIYGDSDSDAPVNRYCSNHNGVDPCTAHLSAAASSELVPVLTSACPNVNQLCISGAAGQEMMRLFGALWPKMTMEDWCELPLNLRTLQRKALPSPDAHFTFPPTLRLPRLEHIVMWEKEMLMSENAMCVGVVCLWPLCCKLPRL